MRRGTAALLFLMLACTEEVPSPATTGCVPTEMRASKAIVEVLGGRVVSGSLRAHLIGWEPSPPSNSAGIYFSVIYPGREVDLGWRNSDEDGRAEIDLTRDDVEAKFIRRARAFEARYRIDDVLCGSKDRAPIEVIER